MPSPDKKTEQANKLAIALNQRQHLISWTIFAIVLALGYVVLLQGKISQLNQSGSSILSAKSSALADLDAYSQKLGELDAKIKSFQEKYKQAAVDLNQILPSQAQVPELIAELDALVKQAGFTLNSLDIAEAGKTAKTDEAADNPDAAAVAPASPAPPADNNLTNVQPVDITMAVTGGDYPAFKVLLDKIEKNIRLLDLVSIKFSAGGSAAGPAGTGYSLILRTYYFSAPK
ncbi:MAG: hypothetical protein NTZ18_02995 [Candidatus Komeilibacteria bacterium]|nr:hypothetical protein [Candidatus Komeilibacteria bacterium]